MQCQFVQAALCRPCDLTGGTEGVFVIYQQVGQVIVPQVPGKSIGICHFYQTADTAIEEWF